MVSTALNQSSRARGVGVQTLFRKAHPGAAVFLPQSLSVVGAVNTASNGIADLTDREFTEAAAVGQAFGLGSPLHIAALELFPEDGRASVGSIPVVFHPYESTATKTDGSITFSGVATGVNTYTVKISGNVYTVTLDGTITEVRDALLPILQAAVNEPFTFTANSTDAINLVPKFTGGMVGNIVVEIESTGYTAAYVAATSQGNNGFPTDLVDRVRFSKDTLLVMCMNAEDGAGTEVRDFLIGLDNEWSAEQKAPKVALFSERPTQGYMDALRNFRSGLFLTTGKQGAGASVSNPISIIARAAMRIAVRADSDPAHDYGRLVLDGIELPTQEPNFGQRDADIKDGYSTTEIRDGVLTLSDMVTTYRPENQLDPAYRYLVDVVKLQNIIYNIDLIFNSVEWDGAPLVPDSQVVTNPRAKQPKKAVAALATLTDTLGNAAIVSDPEGIKPNIIAQINSQNAKRLDICYPPLLGGNANQISVDLKFSFFLGG